MNLENCTYVPEGTPGHGFDGYLVVSILLLHILSVQHTHKLSRTI
jgi:hypothetical protein